MRTYHSRSAKASRIIDADLGRQSRNGTDAGHRHQTPADEIILNYLEEHTM
jgi:hypothetical protein